VREGLNVEKLAAIVIDLLPTPRSKFEFFVYRQAFKTLQLQASTADYTNTLVAFFQQKREQPHLNRVLDFNSLDHIADGAAFFRIVTAIITHGNLTNKSSTELGLYFIFSRAGADLVQLSLFTEFSLKMLDNKYFEMLKDFIEDFFANRKPTVAQTCHVVGLIRRVAQCEKTEFSAKLLDLVQHILSVLNGKDVERMDQDERRLLEMCIGVLTDMIENSVLQFFLTLSIVRRKYPNLAHALQKRVQQGAYSFGFNAFLATVRNELYDLNLDECFFTFAVKRSMMSQEEGDAYDTCIQTNEIAFEYLLPSKDCAAIQKLAFYILDQGLRARIAKEYFASGTAGEDKDDGAV